MQLSDEQKKMIEQQKEQCIFCQIIAGKIPSRKVYEDKLLIGILDINPASQGHVLFMPKEHYPITPLIPPETFKQLAIKTREVDKCIKEALLCKETTIFIANGVAAGQQSNHFMLHIIPRESRDELQMLNIDGKKAPEKDIEETIEKLRKNLNATLSRNLQSKTTGEKVTKDQLLQIIDSNVQLKDAILNKKEQFKKIVVQNPQLNSLFADFDIDEISKEVKNRQKPKSLKLEGALK